MMNLTQTNFELWTLVIFLSGFLAGVVIQAVFG